VSSARRGAPGKTFSRSPAPDEEPLGKRFPGLAATRSGRPHGGRLRCPTTTNPPILNASDKWLAPSRELVLVGTFFGGDEERSPPPPAGGGGTPPEGASPTGAATSGRNYQCHNFPETIGSARLTLRTKLVPCLPQYSDELVVGDIPRLPRRSGIDLHSYAFGFVPKFCQLLLT